MRVRHLGLMMTSALFYNVLHILNITVDIRNICVFLAPLFSSFTTIVTYKLTTELRDSGAGLIAATLISVVPGYISRSVAGSYDNEGIAIFCMILTFYLWVKAVKTGSILWSALCSVAYFYMVTAVADPSVIPAYRCRCPHGVATCSSSTSYRFTCLCS